MAVSVLETIPDSKTMASFGRGNLTLWVQDDGINWLGISPFPWRNGRKACPLWVRDKPAVNHRGETSLFRPRFNPALGHDLCFYF
jgi:hypothetical protein